MVKLGTVSVDCYELVMFNAEFKDNDKPIIEIELIILVATVALSISVITLVRPLSNFEEEYRANYDKQ